MNKEKLLIFDFDGVIADSMKLVKVFYNKIHKKYHLPYANNEKVISDLFHKNVYEGLADAGLPKEKARDFLEDMKKMTFENEDSYEPFEGIKESLYYLYKKGYLIAIISSNHTDIIDRFLNKYDFDDIFTEIHGAEANTSKVEKILLLMNKLNFENKYTYYIGDTVGDVKEGSEAKVHTVAVSWGYHSKKDLQLASPEFLFNKSSDLKSL